MGSFILIPCQDFSYFLIQAIILIFILLTKRILGNPYQGQFYRITDSIKMIHLGNVLGKLQFSGGEEPGQLHIYGSLQCCLSHDSTSLTTATPIRTAPATTVPTMASSVFCFFIVLRRARVRCVFATFFLNSFSWRSRCSCSSYSSILRS